MARDRRFRLLWTPFIGDNAGRFEQALGLCCPGGAPGGTFAVHVGRRQALAAADDLARWPGGCDGAPDAAVYLWPVPAGGRAARIRAIHQPLRGRATEARLLLQPPSAHILHVVCPLQPPSSDNKHASGSRSRIARDAWRPIVAELDDDRNLPSWYRPVWSVEAGALMDVLDDERIPSAERRRLEQALVGGRIVPTLAPETLRADLLGIESLCRSLYAGRDLARRYGLDVPAAAIVPAGPGVCAALAMAVRAAGGRVLCVRPEPGGFRPDVPELFWWKLPDDRRLLCAWPKGDHVLSVDENRWRHRLVIGSRAVLKQFRWLARRFEPATLRWARPEEFAAAVIRDHGSQLPVVDKEFAGPSPCVPDLEAAGTARRAAERLAAAETLASLTAWRRRRPVSVESSGRAVAAHALLALAAAGCGLPDGEQKPGKLADAAGGLADGLEAREALHLARRVVTRRGSGTVLVFNTLPWARGGLVRMWDRNLPDGAFELIDPTTGGSVLYERSGGTVEFIAPRVPACGWLALEARPVERRIEPGHAVDWTEARLTLHNEVYSLQFHAAGGMCRWHDRAMSCQWCSTEAPFPMGAVVADMPARHRPADARVVPLLSPLCSRILVDAEGPAGRYRSTFTLYRDRPELYVRIERPARAGGPNGGAHAFFGLLGESPFLLIDRVTHVIEPGQDLFGGGRAPAMAVSRGLRVEGSHAGMNVFSLDAPLIGFGRPAGTDAASAGTAGGPGVCKVRRTGSQTGQLYVALPSRPARPSVAEFVLQPTGNDAWDGRLAQSGAEFCRPLVALALRGRANEPSASLLRIEPSCVHLVTLKPADDGQGFMLRLWNADVDPVTAEIACPTARGRGRLLLCDALERPTGRHLAMRGGSARLRLNGYELATLRLNRPAP